MGYAEWATGIRSELNEYLMEFLSLGKAATAFIVAAQISFLKAVVC